MKKMCGMLIALVIVLTFVLMACDNTPPQTPTFDIDYVYSAAKEAGYTGTKEDLIEALQGDSAYDIAVAKGYKGTEAEWLESLIGASGSNGISPHIENGYWYIGSQNTSVKAVGEDGQSAFELWKELHGEETSTEQDFLDWLKVKGDKGESAFDIWKRIYGTASSTEQDFLDWLESEPGAPGAPGEPGAPGKSAYDIFLEYNPDYLGDEEQWINDLVNGRLVKFTITFKVAGNPDIVKSVFYGYDLTDIPEVPEKVGNTGEWSVTNFENITQNIEVTAIYKTIGLTFELINGNTEARLASSNLTSDTTILSIPEEYEGKPVTTIGYRAFYYNTNITHVIIPNTVTAIEQEVFLGCTSIKEMTIPFVGANLDGGSTGDISSKFGYLFGVRNISIPQSLTSVIITGGTKLRIFAFSQCEYIKSIVLPNTLIEIGGMFDDGGASGGYQVFEYCRSLETINIPYGVTVLGVNLFKGCHSLKSIALPNTLQDIQGGAFEECKSLTSIEIPDSVKTIGSYAFARCDNLESINIPDSLIAFDDAVFHNSPKIQYEIFNSYLKYIGDICFGTTNTSISVAELKPTTKFITGGAFEGCSNLNYIEIPASVLSFGEGVFYNSNNFTTIYYLGANLEDWNNIFVDGYNAQITNADVLFFSETPIYDGNHWRYVGNAPTVWVE